MDSSASDSEDGGGRRGLGAGGRRRKRGGNEENILGVFADGSDSDDQPRKGKGKGRGKGSITPSGTVDFVRGTTLNKTHKPAAAPARDHGESDDEVDPRFRLNAEPDEPVEEGPKLPAKNELSFDRMAANYGKGFSMLKKMGFTGGGLGRKNDGIANPIMVQVRKGKQGIQNDGEKVDQDLYGTEHIADRRSVEELLTPKPAKRGQPKASEGWKKDAAEKKPRTVYKTAAEVAGEKGSMRIVDMRGPDVKIASSFSELASVSGDSVKHLKELRHNTRLLVAKFEDQIRTISEKKKYYEDVLISVSKETEQMKAAKSLSPDDIRVCKNMVRKIEDVRKLQDQQLISLKELAQVFESLRCEQPKAFQALRAFDVAIALAVPVAKHELAGWSPLKKPKDGLVALSSWNVFETDGMKAVSLLCDEVLLPKLRSTLIDWSVRDSEPCISLFECCQASLPEDVVHILASQIILPRIQVEVESWNPRTDSMPVHIWIHPWLPTLGEKLNCLWTPIRFKLSSCLDQWDPRDRSAMDVLKPWQHVFKAADWDPLIEKVLLRLGRAISDTPVKPSGQDLAPIQDLLAWLDLLPVALIARVLDSALFPQWQAALRTWLRSPECDYSEVLQWYQGWRTLLPSAVRDQGPVQKQLAHGLEVMKSLMSGAADAEVPESAQSQASQSPPKHAPMGRSTSSVAPEDVIISLSDYMGDVAAEHGLLYRPKPGVTHLGKQIYQFGAASIYFDKNLVYAGRKGASDDWMAVSFEEVLKLGKRPEKK